MQRKSERERVIPEGEQLAKSGDRRSAIGERLSASDNRREEIGDRREAFRAAEVGEGFLIGKKLFILVFIWEISKNFLRFSGVLLKDKILNNIKLGLVQLRFN